MRGNTLVVCCGVVGAAGCIHIGAAVLQTRGDVLVCVEGIVDLIAETGRPIHTRVAVAGEGTSVAGSRVVTTTNTT